jgi:hypothetical protein
MGHFCAIKARHLSDRPPKLSPFQAEALDTQFPANRLNSREIPKFDPLPSAQNRRKCRCHSGFLQNRSTKQGNLERLTGQISCGTGKLASFEGKRPFLAHFSRGS